MKSLLKCVFIKRSSAVCCQSSRGREFGQEVITTADEEVYTEVNQDLTCMRFVSC